MMMFKEPYRNNIANSLFTGLNILVSKSETTDDLIYNECVEYLNANLTSIPIKDLIHKEDENDGLQLYSFVQAKVLSIFTNFNPNTQTSSSHVHPFDTLTDKLLNHPNISKHIKRTSIISVRYHTEHELERQGKLHIFSPQNAVALVIADNVTELKTHFYKAKDRLTSKYGIFIQFLLVKFNDEFEIVHPADISEDCETEANAIQTGTNDLGYLDFNKNSVFLINSVITKYLRTVVYHILRYLMHSILNFLDSPEYEHEFLTDCYDISTASNIYKGRLHKIVGDMYMLLDNVDSAISSYISSEQQCKAVSDNLFLGKSSLCLAVALSIKHNLSIFLRSDSCELGADKPLCFSFFTDQLLHSCIPTYAIGYNGISVKNINTTRYYPAKIDGLDDSIEISDDAMNVEESIGGHAENDNVRDKKTLSDPRDAILSAFERAFNVFVEYKNSSTFEFELLFIIFSNWLSSNKYNIQLHSIISKFIKYSQLNKNIQEQCLILKYIIDISNAGKYKRKLDFYLYLYEVAINSLKDPAYETYLGDLKLIKPEHKYIEANDCNVECLIDSMIHFIESNVLNGSNAVHKNYGLHSKTQLCNSYGHWYHICRTWINIIIKRCARDGLYDELYHLIFIKFWMTIDYVLEYRPRDESSVGIIDEAVMELKRQFLNTPSFNNKLLCITHLICNTSENKNLRQRNKYTNPRDILDSNIRHLFDSYCYKNSVLFFGYFGEIKLSKAPLVLSMSCDVGITKTMDTDTGFTHDLMIKSENNRSKSKSNQKIKYFIKIKKHHLYRTCCKCSFKGIFQNSGKTNSRVESLSSSISSLKSSCKRTEPHSHILNNKIYNNNKCVIVKCRSKHGEKCIESCKTKPKALRANETCVLSTSVMTTDQVYEIELELYNPLPIAFTMENLMFIAIGSKIDILCDNIRLPAFSNSYKVKLPIMMKQAGTIYIVGLSFTAFNVFRFNQMVLQGTGDLIREFSLNFGKGIEIKDEVLDNFRKGASIVFNVSHKRDSARANCYITNFNSTSRMTHHESLDYICKYSKNTFETYSSVIGPNDKRKYELWSGIRIPLFDDGCISKLIAQCTESYCIWRRIFELHGKESIFEDRSVFERVIQGERRLLYITLANESKAFKYSNVQLSIIPKYYEEEQSSKFDVKTWEDIKLEKMKENLTFRENQCIVSKCLYIANNEGVVINKDVLTQLGENSLHVEICSHRKDVENRTVSLNSGDILCVPVIYKADLLCNFHVIFDYELEFVDGGLNHRGSTFMELNFDVDYGIKIDNVNLESCVEFNYKRLLRNISIFANCYMDSTVFMMRNSVHIFDHQCVKAYLNVVNDTNIQFKCTTHLNELISVPGSNIRWCIKMKRLNYLKAKYIKPWEFVKIFDSKLGLKWNIDSKRTGDIQIHDTALYKEPVKGTRSKLPRDYYRNELLSIYQKPFLWKMVGINNNSNLVIYPLKIPSLIDKNLHNLVMSKVSLELSVSIPSSEKSYSSGDQVQIPLGLPFNFHVYAKNAGDKIIDDYCVLVFPYVHESYTEPNGLSWIGSLERVGHCAILPESKRRQDILKSESKLIRDTGLNSASSVQRFDQSYVSCAHVTFIAHGSCIYGINAAIIIKSENNVYWHHTPIIITTT